MIFFGHKRIYKPRGICNPGIDSPVTVRSKLYSFDRQMAYFPGIQEPGIHIIEEPQPVAGIHGIAIHAEKPLSGDTQVALMASVFYMPEIPGGLQWIVKGYNLVECDDLVLAEHIPLVLIIPIPLHSLLCQGISLIGISWCCYAIIRFFKVESPIHAWGWGRC